VFRASAKAGNPFYQIYVMDLASGDVKANLARHGEDHMRLLQAR